MKCPDCSADLKPRSTACECGWRKEFKARRYDGDSTARGADFEPLCCQWEADGRRCRYPGTISADTHGGGRWYCAAHDQCADPLLGAQIVEQSHREHGPRVGWSHASAKAASIRHATVEAQAAGFGDVGRDEGLDALRRFAGLKRIPDSGRRSPAYAPAPRAGRSPLPAREPDFVEF